MYSYFKKILVILLPVLISCSGKNSNIEKNLEDEPKIGSGKYYFYKNCSISKDSIKQREVGNNIVFHYIYNYDYGTPNSSYIEELMFQISCCDSIINIKNTSLNNFNLKYFTKGNIETPKINTQMNGSIFVKKLTDKYLVVLYALIDEKEIYFSKIFTEFTPNQSEINNYDIFNRKTGKWIVDNKVGYFQENYFTGEEWYTGIENKPYDSCVLYIQKNQIFKANYFKKSVLIDSTLVISDFVDSEPQNVPTKP